MSCVHWWCLGECKEDGVVVCLCISDVWLCKSVGVCKSVSIYKSASVYDCMSVQASEFIDINIQRA